MISRKAIPKHYFCFLLFIIGCNDSRQCRKETMPGGIGSSQKQEVTDCQYIYRKTVLPESSGPSRQWVTLEVDSIVGKQLVASWVTAHEKELVAADIILKLAIMGYAPPELLCVHGGETARRYFVMSAIPTPRNSPNNRPQANIAPADILELEQIFEKYGRPSDWQSP